MTKTIVLWFSLLTIAEVNEPHVLIVLYHIYATLDPNDTCSNNTSSNKICEKFTQNHFFLVQNSFDVLRRNVYIPMVKALAKMTEDRMKTIMEDLLRISTTFLTAHCPQNPANIDTPIKYRAARIKKQEGVSGRWWWWWELKRNESETVKPNRRELEISLGSRTPQLIVRRRTSWRKLLLHWQPVE